MSTGNDTGGDGQNFFQPQRNEIQPTQPELTPLQQEGLTAYQASPEQVAGRNRDVVTIHDNGRTIYAYAGATVNINDDFGRSGSGPNSYMPNYEGAQGQLATSRVAQMALENRSQYPQPYYQGENNTGYIPQQQYPNTWEMPPPYQANPIGQAIGGFFGALAGGLAFGGGRFGEGHYRGGWSEYRQPFQPFRAPFMPFMAMAAASQMQPSWNYNNQNYYNQPYNYNYTQPATNYNYEQAANYNSSQPGPGFDEYGNPIESA